MQMQSLNNEEGVNVKWYWQERKKEERKQKFKTFSEREKNWGKNAKNVSPSQEFEAALTTLEQKYTA